MRRYNRRRFKSSRTDILDVRGFPRGVNTLVNPNMIRPDELAEAINVAYAQYGVLKKRAGTKLITNLGASVQGFGELHRRDPDTHVRTSYFCAIAGGKFFVIDPIEGTSSEQEGYTFHATNRVKMVQGGNELYIFDGHSPLVKWDGTEFIEFEEIDAPENVAVAKVGSATGTRTISYIVSAANAVGETVGSTAVQLTSAPNAWDVDTYADLTWDAVDGATSYNVYKGSPGNETFLTSVDELQFFDQGQADDTQSYVILVPDENTTGGITFTTGTVFHQSIIGVEKNNPTRLWFSAGGDKIDSFSPGDGGGWYDYHPETGESINGVEVFAGLGKDYVYIFKDHKTGQFAFGSQGQPEVSDVNLAVGAASDASIVLFENDLAFWSPYGAYTLRMEPNFVNVLRISELTVRVHPTHVDTVTRAALPQVCGVYDKSNHVILWSIPAGNPTNNTSLAYDPVYVSFSEYRGIAATAFTKFVDEDNNEFAYGGDALGNVFTLFHGTSDMGAPIRFRASTKLFDMDTPYAFKRFRKVFLLFGNIQAQDLQVSLVKDGLEEITRFSVASELGETGWGADLWGNVLWGDSSGSLIATNNRTVLRFVDVNQDLFNMQVVYTNESARDSFEILSLFIEWRASRKRLLPEMRVG